MNSSKANPSTAQPQRNYSLLAIPAVYTLAFPPHLFEFAVAMRASNYSYTNILPRTNVDSSFLKDKMSKGAWESIVKARGAHMNALEGFPLFAGAMVLVTTPVMADVLTDSIDCGQLCETPS